MQSKRLFLVAKYIWENADDTHFVTIHQIQDYIAESNERGDRKTISEDIDYLIECGMQIRCVLSRQNRYYLDNHIFEQSEIHLLKDAVQSSKFISKENTEILMDKLSLFECNDLKSFSQKYQYVEKYPKAENEKLLSIIHSIEQAIETKTKVVFQYAGCSMDKRTILRHNGQKYTFSPYNTIWKDDNYYVVGWDETHGGIIGTYRIDRIRNIENTDVFAFQKPKGYSPAKYHKEIFSMCQGETTAVTLLCENDLLQSIVERFGKKVPVTVIDDNHFSTNIDVSLGPTFYAWVVSFGGRMKINNPINAVEGLKELIENLIM